jgi:hypothetical protein
MNECGSCVGNPLMGVSGRWIVTTNVLNCRMCARLCRGRIVLRTGRRAWGIPSMTPYRPWCGSTLEGLVVRTAGR